MKILSLGDLRCRQDLRYEARVYHEFVAVCICVSVAQPWTVQIRNIRLRKPSKCGVGVFVAIVVLRAMASFLIPAGDSSQTNQNLV